jgi:IS4 transposase
MSKVAASGARFIVRICWQNLPLEGRDGTPFDILSALRSLDEAVPGEFAVCLRGDPERRPYRLVAIRKSEPAAQESRRKLLISSRKDQRNLDPRSLEVAGYVFVLTNLEQSLTPGQILDLYALRWQVEIRFKSLKSVIALDHLPVRNFELAQTYLAARLLIAVLIEELVFRYESFPPWGYPLVAASQLADHQDSA